MIINIITSFIIMFWPVMFMMSPMMFDAPGSQNDTSHVLSLVLILSYPIFIFLFFWLMGWQFWGISGKKMFIISTAIIGTGFYAFGYFNLLFLTLRGIAPSGYSVANNTAYYNGKPLEQAQADNFVILGDRHTASTRDTYYAKDRQHVFYDGNIIQQAHADSFHKLDIDYSDYWADKQHVYYRGKALAHAKPEGFRKIGTGSFYGWTIYQDSKHGYVYYDDRLLSDANVEHFSLLSAFIAKDDHHIFLMGHKILPEADADSFQLYPDTDEYAHDNSRVYHILTAEKTQVLKDVNPAEFTPLERGYAKTATKVFHQTDSGELEEVMGADADSFTVGYIDSKSADAQDKTGYYYEGKRL